MLPIIVAGSRPAVAGLTQSQHFDCDTSADLHRLRRASITETARSRVSFASTVLLNPIGSYRLPHPHQPNRHRARRTASRIPSRDFLLWRIATAGPQAAEFAATPVTGRHPTTFTWTDSGTATRPGRFRICWSGVQFGEQGLGLFQIDRVETRGEPAVDRREEIMGLLSLA